jgi:hypothetical protein
MMAKSYAVALIEGKRGKKGRRGLANRRRREQGSAERKRINS